MGKTRRMESGLCIGKGVTHPARVHPFLAQKRQQSGPLLARDGSFQRLYPVGRLRRAVCLTDALFQRRGGNGRRRSLNHWRP